MIIQPKIRGFICTTAHPEGCARAVQDQIDWVKAQAPFDGPKKVLVIGSSTGYGLASRIAASFGAGAATLGVFFERPADKKRTASAGWYNTVGFENAARAAGHYARSINGDAFSDEIKAQTIAAIKEDLQQVDLVVYSLASPRRTHPKTGESFSSVLKPIGDSYTSKTVNVQTGEVSDISIETASEEEIAHTTAVMGGEDWEMWIHALDEAGVLAEGVRTVAYTYIGPELTHPVYRDGTIGRAKNHLEQTGLTLNEYLQNKNGSAHVSTNKAMVTQSSAAIPVVPLYISLLYKIMKEKDCHENCIQQMYRLFADRLYTDAPPATDDQGRIRIDDWEMREDVQAAVAALWSSVNTETLEAVSDITSYREEFLGLFGFGFDGIDYEVDVNPDRPL
ncbi:MAG: trans-2-enoyl-CoA reductase family protein [Gemmatimonadetes bacterium]|jgi:enoyl-[acyl-carrier protein] reductase/trans-2-enoyl-CoA reductase (NAD+)|nr:trans-2-enoyl-CoA reductase family protein [Gemmatimonadota bacterium]MBT5451576.1 trans-2-enoyl-CoA reductase family protein [Gemmatimonadota bacterium]MBT5800194.1 trans-2-enoyl-CoA reductase family protein [Gemmatimonadota bacterium]MBT6620521.1 trans-2-enoyl-CoA reductase family protein [Gemmatimonadota bacterium]MBT6904373.1 trans-2-enoyl-CoA reductase family protein [Gemmatimonadota bacterium]